MLGAFAIICNTCVDRRCNDERCGDEAWDGIEREARDLLALFARRDGAVVGRHGHWWARLTVAQARVFRAA